MDSGILLAIGLIFAFIALSGFVIAIMNLKDIHRRERNGSEEERNVVPPPSIQSKYGATNKNIEFGEVLDLEKKPKYSERVYVEIRSAVKSDQCPYCRNPVVINDGFVCPKCGSQYHLSCFRENKNTCGNCKWIQP